MLLRIVASHGPYVMRRVCYSGLLGCLVVLFFFHSVRAATWQEEFSQAQVLGQGEFSWFGLSIYKAQLWSEQRPFNPRAHFALQLTYQRHLSGQRIAETGIKEIRRIYGNQVSAEQLSRWQRVLISAIPDVKAGSQLIAVYEPSYGLRIYDAKQQIADIADPELARAFFAIWLDERTKDQMLRSRLLGNYPETK